MARTPNSTTTSVVLIAESDPRALERAERALTSRNYVVVTVASAREALTYLHQSTPSLVVLSTHLPDLTGLEVVARVRRVPRLEGVPIILLTEGTQGVGTEGVEAPSCSLLAKPFTGSELSRVVEELLKARLGDEQPLASAVDAAHTIMVIEDSAALRGLITDILHRQGYRVQSAENVPQARALITSSTAQVSLILLDVNLPGGTGFDLLKLVRERSGVPIFILSALRHEEQVARGRALGAQDFIEKPFNPRDLVRKIKEVLT